jgi:hypothetical protein
MHGLRRYDSDRHKRFFLSIKDMLHKQKSPRVWLLGGLNSGLMDQARFSRIYLGDPIGRPGARKLRLIQITQIGAMPQG